MPATLRLATFNVNNLFARYRFREDKPAFEGDDGFTVNDLAFDRFSEEEKRLTGKAVRELDADVVALQEVESLPVLDRFASEYLKGMGYDHRIVIDSFDPRHIDVGVLSRHPFSNLRTHRHERTASGKAKLFSRDCLEVELALPGDRAITLYVNHFKSMLGGRAATRARREAQAERVAEIVAEGWDDDAYRGNFAVLGDFNDYVDAATSLSPLLGHKAGFRNVVERLPEAEQWTHHYAGDPDPYKQLDYILLPEALDKRAGRPVPEVMRKGLPRKAARYTGPRFPEVGAAQPKASDHAGLVVELPLAAFG